MEQTAAMQEPQPVVQAKSSDEKYTPESDEYDVRTAILPPSESEDSLVKKQISALRRRIARGGDPAVISHYERLVIEMEGGVGCEEVLPDKSNLSSKHMRIGSTNSNASTCCSDDNLDLEVDCSPVAASAPTAQLPSKIHGQTTSSPASRSSRITQPTLRLAPVVTTKVVQEITNRVVTRTIRSIRTIQCVNGGSYAQPSSPLASPAPSTQAVRVWL